MYCYLFHSMWFKACNLSPKPFFFRTIAICKCFIVLKCPCLELQKSICELEQNLKTIHCFNPCNDYWVYIFHRLKLNLKWSADKLIPGSYSYSSSRSSYSSSWSSYGSVQALYSKLRPGLFNLWSSYFYSCLSQTMYSIKN